MKVDYRQLLENMIEGVYFTDLDRRRPFMAGVSAACAGIEGLTRAMAAELAPAGVRVMCVRPGALFETRTIRETVAANAALLRIVELDPITAVVYVTERDYGHLRQGQEALLSTDAWPDERFRGRIERIAPVFRESVRQARVELRVDNPRQRLKPGMFVRAEVVFERVAQTLVVPEAALTRREQREGVFVVRPDGQIFKMPALPMTPNVRAGFSERPDSRFDGLLPLVADRGRTRSAKRQGSITVRPRL